MNAILDPAFFAGSPDENDLCQDLDFILQFLRAVGATLWAVPDYWNPLWLELIRPLQQKSPRLDLRLSQFRKVGTPAKFSPVSEPESTPPTDFAWGFKSMFGSAGLSSDWPDRMAAAAWHLIRANKTPFLLCKPVLGRNLKRHQAKDTVLDEPLRWRLYLQPRTPNPVEIACVYHRRHLEQPWTTRYDWRLPGAADGARCPFCPAEKWWKRDTVAVTTHQSKPVFVDRLNNFWAPPNTPGVTRHWDVFIINPNLVQQIGLDQINVVQFGAPPEEGSPGDLHHVPTKKKGSLRTESGWKCPD